MHIISSNDRNTIRVFFSPQLFNFVSEFLARSIKKEKNGLKLARDSNRERRIQNICS
jgi:hypothetical protein